MASRLPAPAVSGLLVLLVVLAGCGGSGTGGSGRERSGAQTPPKHSAAPAAAGCKQRYVPPKPAAGKPAPRPAGHLNVVVLMSDDQDNAAMCAMPATRRLLVNRGTTFSHSYVSFSLCCPSRATFQTGQYAHNHHIYGAELPPSRSTYAGMRARMSSDTLPIWLHRAGYSTAFIGKYFNGYGRYGAETPPGWDDWVVPSNDESLYRAEGFSLNENGKPVRYDGVNQADVLTDRAIDFIRSPDAHRKPFFLYVGYVQPHVGKGGPQRCAGGAPPDPRYSKRFATVPLPRSPSVGEKDVSDKPKYVRKQPPLTGKRLHQATVWHRCRLQALLSVDAGVKRIHDALRRAGEIRNTVIVYTSDNGFLEGQHGIIQAKLFPYEESQLVPLVVSGGGATRGATLAEPVINTDLAPTILDLAGAQTEPGYSFDGRSWAPLLRGGSVPKRRDLLFEAFFKNHQTGGVLKHYDAAVRTRRYQYTEYWTGEHELYDLGSDPYELRNRAGDPQVAPLEGKLAARLDRIRNCAGNREDPVRGRTPCW